jgi:chemotaxis signal transduction protein
VVDLSILLGGEPQQTSLFLVLSGKDEKTCFRVTQILEFHDGTEVALNRIADSPEIRFFSGTVAYGEVQIPIWNPAAIIEKIRADLENT